MASVPFTIRFPSGAPSKLVYNYSSIRQKVVHTSRSKNQRQYNYRYICNHVDISGNWVK